MRFQHAFTLSTCVFKEITFEPTKEMHVVNAS